MISTEAIMIDNKIVAQILSWIILALGIWALVNRNSFLDLLDQADVRIVSHFYFYLKKDFRILLDQADVRSIFVFSSVRLLIRIVLEFRIFLDQAESRISSCSL